MSLTPEDAALLGASDLPALLGLSPWGGPIALWARMVHGIQGESTEAMEEGTLAEPYIRSSTMFVNDPTMPMDPYPCEEATETALERGRTPHFLPGQSPLPGLDPKLTDRFGTPPEARLGGPATMYPEYIAKMKTMPVPKQVGTPRD